jgi:hypothetical protein
MGALGCYRQDTMTTGDLTQGPNRTRVRRAEEAHRRRQDRRRARPAKLEHLLAPALPRAQPVPWTHIQTLVRTNAATARRIIAQQKNTACGAFPGPQPTFSANLVGLTVSALANHVFRSSPA